MVFGGGLAVLGGWFWGWGRVGSGPGAVSDRPGPGGWLLVEDALAGEG